MRVKADEDNPRVLGENESSIIEFKLNDNKHYRDVIINVNNFGGLNISLGPISKYYKFYCVPFCMHLQFRLDLDLVQDNISTILPNASSLRYFRN